MGVIEAGRHRLYISTACARSVYAAIGFVARGCVIMNKNEANGAWGHN